MCSKGIGPLLFASLIVFLGHPTCSWAARDLIDLSTSSECTEWANRGDCTKRDRSEFMIKQCAKTCADQPGVFRVEQRPIEEDKGDFSFYDLEAKNAKGKTMSFDRFEGYVTILVNAARKCGESEQLLEELEHLHSTYPYSLEIMAFPHDIAGQDNSDEDCYQDILKSELKEGRKIHVMEKVHIGGPNTHPVFQFLRARFELEKMDEHVPYFFLLNPDGDTIELHNFRTLKSHISKQMHVDLGGDAKVHVVDGHRVDDHRFDRSRPRQVLSEGEF